MHHIRDIIKKNKKIIIYFCFSGASALIESGLLLLLKNSIPYLHDHIVYANTIAVFISSVFHFIMTSSLVFKVKMNFSSILVYLATFFMGLGIQNLVIWLTYEKLLSHLIHNDTLLTLACKICSLASSFFITYFVRSWLNKKLKAKEES